MSAESRSKPDGNDGTNGSFLESRPGEKNSVATPPSSRRDFIKKTAVVIAAIGASSALLGKAVIPESSASSYLSPVYTNTSNAPGNLAVWECFCGRCPCSVPTLTGAGCSGPDFGSRITGNVQTLCPIFCCCNPLGATLTIFNTACEGISCPVGVAGLTERHCPADWPGGAVGVLGLACTGIGVSGSSKSGIGVLGYALSPCSTPIVAVGVKTKGAPTQEWISPCQLTSVVAHNGYFGLGTKSPKAPLDVNGTISGSQLGICTLTPHTTLGINGSISAKLITEIGSSVLSSYSMAKNDFALLVDATVLPTGVKTFTVTLPPANTATGMIVFIKRVDASTKNTVTVQGSGSGSTQDKIEDSTAPQLLGVQFASLTLVSGGGSPGDWYILANGT